MSILRNFIYNTIYQVFIILLPIITVPYISRVLGKEGVGIYSYTASYAQYFVLLGMIGISIYGNRQIAYNKGNREKVSKEFSNIYLLQFITTTISLIVYLTIFVGINKENKLLFLVQGLPILAAIFDISWLFIGYEDMKSVVIRNSIAKLIGISLIFIFVKKPSDIILYALILGISTCVGQVVMWFNLTKVVSFSKPNIKEAILHLRPSLSLFISQLAIQVYVLLDKTMLGLMTDSGQVGLYDSSQKTIKLALTLVTSLGTVMLPRMSSLYAEGKMDKFKEMIYKAFSFVNLVAIPMVFGLVAIADGFSVWFYGEKFSGIEILLKVGSLIIFAISWSNILGIQIMIPMKKERQFTISVTIGAIVNILLNFLLIVRFKSIGTTVSSVAAEITVTIIQLYMLRDFIEMRKILKTIYKPLIGSILMFLVIAVIGIILPIGIIYTIIEVGIGLGVYIFTMIILKDKFLLGLLDMGLKIIKR
ncbi:flippase [Clostridium paraputrificum]|uniref:flippase n=1 Tax=Clostridium paraputrificum TaxID=29363 RepID=UPI003D358F75